MFGNIQLKKYNPAFLCTSQPAICPHWCYFFLRCWVVLHSVFCHHIFPEVCHTFRPSGPRTETENCSWPHVCILHAATHERTSLVCPHQQVTEHLATAASCSLDPSLGRWSSDPASSLQDPGWRFLGHGHSLLDPIQSHMGSYSFI